MSKAIISLAIDSKALIHLTFNLLRLLDLNPMFCIFIQRRCVPTFLYIS